MKVAVELQPCLKNRSGIGVYTYELSKRLQLDTNIQLTGDIFNFLQRNDLSQDLLGIEFKQEVCKLFPYGIYRRIWNYIPIKYNKLFKREADITHFFNFIVPPRIEGKVITTIYGLTFGFFPETMDRRNLKRLKDDILYSIPRVDHMSTISECSKKDIVEVLGISPNKIDIVYPGIDFEHFNQRRLLDIVTKVRDIKLVIAGKKGWMYEGIFTGFIEESVLEALYQKATCYVSTSLYEEIVSYYARAKAFIFPGEEDFELTPIEAKASGTHVSAYDRGGRYGQRWRIRHFI